MDNYIGRLLDNRYEILEAIGTGGMAVVYKARCHRLNRMVALKVLKDELSVDAEFRRRFHAESQAVAMLSHPNIVNVYDVSHSENVDYIVMELIEGLTLKQYMQQKGALNWREALHLSTQIAKALEHAHSRGIIHRDIKPHNIMILKDGTVKVADFGIARVSSAQNTLTREALGSVHYISPEQAKGGKIDYRSDLYSLGVVMYEMLTGRPPYDGETPVAVAIKHINAQADLPRTINPQVPLGLEQITMHAMEADLEKRYENATDMLVDLDEFRRNPNVNFTEETSSVEANRTAELGTAQIASNNPQNRKRQRPKQRGTDTVALTAGIICITLALTFIFALVLYFSGFFTDDAKTLKIPSFIGEIADTIDPKEYPDFVLEYAPSQPSDTVEVGVIIGQEPKAGSSAKAGDTITLTASSGPATDTMRDLVNYMEQNARTILDNLGMKLNIVVEWESSEVYSAGAVIRTIPSAQEPLTVGQTVTLIVSSGTATKYVPVPELVGMNVEEAKDRLTSLNLKFGISYVDADEAEGTVIFQSKAQMVQVKEGSTINLQISNGPKAGEDTDNDVTTSENVNSSVPKIIWLPMPAGDGSVNVVVMIDDEVNDEFQVELVTVSENGVPIAPDIDGVHDLDVYVDGKLWHSIRYDFDAGEQVER